MSGLDGFYTVWSNARSTLGQGSPQEGSQFDGSTQLRQLQTSVQSAAPGGRWTGTASDAYSDANSKQGQALGAMAGLDQRLGAEVDRSAAVVTAGRRNLDVVKQWVQDAASTVPQGADRDQTLLSIARKGIGDVADVVKQTNSDLNAIGGRIRGIGNEYQALGDEKKKGSDGKDPLDRIVGDKNDEEAKAKTRKDVEDALAGDKDAAARVRRALNTVTPDQLAGKVPLTAEQASYLSQMQAQQHGMSVDALKTAADKGAKDIMANSWQLMSNPKIQFPKTELTHGALDNPNEMVKGGFAQLPESVQNAIESKGLQSWDQMQTIADITHGGNTHFQTNTDLDRGMIHKAADMMNDPYWRDAFGPAAPQQHLDYDRAASSILSAVSPDHQVVHDALTGHVDNPDNDPYKTEFKIDAEKFLYNTTHEAWDDHGAGAGSLFEWTDKAATGPEATIAAETAHAYSHYIGTHEQDLLHLSGDNTPGLSGHHTLGEVNPHLVQDMAHGLTPYVNNIAGLSGGLDHFGDVGTHPNGHLDSATDIKNGTLPYAKGVFSILNTDPNAAKIFDGAAYQQALLHDQAYALHPGAVQPQNLYDSATLRGLVDAGTHNAFQAFREDQHAIGVDEYQWKKSAYEFGVQGLGKIPGAGPEIGFLGSVLEDNILGPPPGSATDHGVPMMSRDMAEHEILNAMVTTGQRVEGLPDSYYAPPDEEHPYWRVRTPEEMQPYGVDTDVYSEVIGQAMATHVAQAQYMEERYNHVIDDPDPQK